MGWRCGVANEFLTRTEEVVDGTYRVGAVVSRSVRSVVYETDARDDGTAAVIRVRELEPGEGARQAERWKEAVKFSHPNLLKVYGAGLCVLNETPIAYVVMERADESLAGVLAERPLTNEEATEMLGPTLSALAYLHKNECAHGSLKPSNIMAAGDKLKLSSDSAVPFAEGGSAEEDVRALGSLIAEALPLGEPTPVFRDILTNCLEPDPESRWTVQEVEKRLYAPTLRVEPAPAVLPAPPVERVPDHAPSPGFPKWVYAALAALVLIVALVSAVRKMGRDKTENNAVAQPVLSQPDASPSIPVVQQPVLSKPAPLPPQVKVPSPVLARKAGGWSVIVAAYGSREAAEKRMHSMGRQWPKFSASVQDQKTDRARYLVVLGQDLSEADAEALRQRAVRSGLPQDTYIKKLKR